MKASQGPGKPQALNPDEKSVKRTGDLSESWNCHWKIVKALVLVCLPDQSADRGVFYQKRSLRALVKAEVRETQG